MTEITPQQVYDGNRLFHFSIYKAANMDRLFKAIEKLWDSLAFFKLNYGRIYVESKEERANAVAEHRQYHELLRKRDAQKLFAAFDNNLERLVQKMPDFFSPN